MFYPFLNYGQVNTKINKVNAQFLLNSDLDNGWYMKLNKNKTYQYKHWNGFLDDSYVLDEGKYAIVGDKITFFSLKGDSSFHNKTNYIKVINKGDRLTPIGRVFKFEIKKLFKRQIIYYSYDPILLEYPPKF